jgi:hypothetical protein
MSGCFVGGGKNERWEEFLAGKADYIPAFVLWVIWNTLYSMWKISYSMWKTLYSTWNIV